MTLPAQLAHIFSSKQKSYKMVLVLALLDQMKESHLPEVSLAAVTSRFLKYLQQREISGLIVDQPPSKLGIRWDQIQVSQMSSTIQTPIQALSSILHYNPSKQTLRIIDDIQRIWSGSIEKELREYALHELEDYYSKMPEMIPLRDHLLKIMTSYIAAKKGEL